MAIARTIADTIADTIARNTADCSHPARHLETEDA
jgi:hypothetical protein